MYAKQANFRAAATAKAAAGREARTHATTGVPRPNAVGTFTTFDAPGAVNGTFPSSISRAGAITGLYNDANFVSHGFLRTSNGTITTFDAPGDVNGTVPSSINPAGAITGYYGDANFVGHGFLRASNGTITTFDAPGDVNGTFPSSINPAGAITGSYGDANFVGHGFLRASNGTITTFDAPGAGTTTGGCSVGFFVGGTQAVSINPAGAILGIYTDANCGPHGFLRASDGSFTTFDPPGPYKPSPHSRSDPTYPSTRTG